MKNKIIQFAAIAMMFSAAGFVSVSFAQTPPPGVNLYVSGPDDLEVDQAGYYYIETYYLPPDIIFTGWDILAPTFDYSSSNLSATNVSVAFHATGNYTVRAKFWSTVSGTFYVDKTVGVGVPLEYFYPYIYTRKLDNNGLMEFYVPDIPSNWLNNCSIQWYVGGHSYATYSYYAPLTGTFPSGLEIKCRFIWGYRYSQMGSTRVP